MIRPINASYLAWRQLVSKRKSLLATISGNVVAFILIFMQLAFEQGIYAAGTSLHHILQADAVMINPASINIGRMRPLNRATYGSLLAHPSISEAAMISTTVASWRSPLDGLQRPALMLGIPIDRDVIAPQWAADWNTSQLEIPGTVLFDQEARPELGGEVIPKILSGKSGFEFQINDHVVQPKQIYPFRFPICTEGTIITSLETFNYIMASPSEATTALLISLKDRSMHSMRRTVARMNRDLPPDAQIFTKKQWIKRETKFWAENTPVGILFRFGVFIGACVSSVFIYQILLSDITAHLSEYATLRAIGYGRWYLRRVVFFQGLFLTVISCPLAMIVSSVLIRLWTNFTKIPLTLTAANILGVIGLGLAVASLSALLATKELACADPIGNL
jgi:putative ABC transport system permease protein